MELIKADYRDLFNVKNFSIRIFSEIFTEDDSVFFYATNKNKILKVYKGFMFCNETYPSARIRFEMEAPTHHIFSEQPLITRSRWNFMLVFFSPFYHNMYFEKGDFSLSD